MKGNIRMSAFQKIQKTASIIRNTLVFGAVALGAVTAGAIASTFGAPLVIAGIAAAAGAVAGGMGAGYASMRHMPLITNRAAPIDALLTKVNDKTGWFNGRDVKTSFKPKADKAPKVKVKASAPQPKPSTPAPKK